jgi:hypothetical protein
MNFNLKQNKRVLFVFSLTLLALIFGLAVDANAHGVTAGDKGYIQEIFGFAPIPFLYLGAKHMITGYDHLLFLVGVIFFPLPPKGRSDICYTFCRRSYHHSPIWRYI